MTSVQPAPSTSVLIMEECDADSLSRRSAATSLSELPPKTTSEEDNNEKTKKKKRPQSLFFLSEVFASDGLLPSRRLRTGLWLSLALLYHVYLAFAVAFHYAEDTDILWCDGLGFVLICTAAVYACVGGMFLVGRLARVSGVAKAAASVGRLCDSLLSKALVRGLLYALVVAAAAVFLLLDTSDDRDRLISALGIVVLVALGAVLSKAPRNIAWRQGRQTGSQMEEA